MDKKRILEILEGAKDDNGEIPMSLVRKAFEKIEDESRMADICNDNRFELIEKYKQQLIECTNIETAPDEMAVINDILFRFWQMGWLDTLERMPLIKESARTLMHSGGDTTASKAMRNAGRFIMNAITGQYYDFEQIEPEQRWILCNEKMPEEDGNYIVSGKWASGKESTGECHYYTHDGYFKTAWNFDVVAWMPLPEPYQEERREDGNQ